MNDPIKKYPEGHFIGMWMGLGIAIFSGVGIPLSIITGNPGLIGIGPALGVAIGVAIGQSIENKHRQEERIRPLTELEQTRKKNAVIIGIILLSLGILLSILLFFL
jgi:predicted nucleic acid-binding Zn ribbon protein